MSFLTAAICMSRRLWRVSVSNTVRSGEGGHSEQLNMKTIRWWQFGILGGFILSLTTAPKLLAALPRLLRADIEWTEFFLFPFVVFSMGFVCGVTVWMLRRWSRLGFVGHVIIGILTMNVFFLCCMIVFDPSFFGENRSNGWLMLGLATLCGAVMGALIGRDMNKMRDESADPTSSDEVRPN